ncbi:anti-sigma-F factor Fin family protein [Virgibacillus oceani]|uniref:Anti-sigma-F factor Fin n=1 Tax=Virgibacillus oceani TaxID=1479511 RepID=A0A917HLF6_9BACI|nr:anti-sigma-F factor Fin family protein [Virgibacillus oceani]GGG82087.1 anti-sigma-F factor Fin [Virgibacillus oceani]
MSFVYQCRHCGQTLGKIEQQVADAAMLGLDKLSIEDKKEMIQYQENGDVQIKTICESCEESLGTNPHYHELDFFIQ